MMRAMAIATLITAVSGLQSCASPRVPPQPPPASAEAVSHVARVEEAPKPLVQTAPRYPEGLRLAGVQGRVTFEVVLDRWARPR